MRKEFWLSLVFGILAFLFVSCIPSGDRWLELMPGNEDLKVTYDTWCLEPAVPEFEQAIQYWNGHDWLNSYMDGIFQERYSPPCGQVRMENSEGCPTGALACVSLLKNADGYLARATIRLTGMWHISSPEWKRAVMHHEVGHVMGLDEFWQDQCKYHPFSGFLTIMGTAERWPFPPCLTYPAEPDIISSVCYNYGYKNNPYGQDCPDFGFSGGGVGVAISLPDIDGDGVEDAVDNCVFALNPDQKDRDIDGFGNVCDNDDDNDDFIDIAEAFMGTDSLDDCPDSSQHDAWPPDFNATQTVNILDIVQLTPPVFNSDAGDPAYTQRKDLNADGSINILDIVKLTPPVFNTSCVSTQSQIVDAIKATEKYLDINVAKSEGFVQVTQPVSGRGAFFINNEIWDDTFDLLQPEGLMYDNDERSVGVFYFIPLWAVPDLPEGFIGPNDVWAIHYGFCIREDGEFIEDVTEEQCISSNGMFYWDEIGHVLFVSLHRHNPDGVFAEINPNVN